MHGLKAQTKDFKLYSLADGSQKTFLLLITSVIHNQSVRQYALRVRSMEGTALGTV